MYIYFGSPLYVSHYVSHIYIEREGERTHPNIQVFFIKENKEKIILYHYQNLHTQKTARRMTMVVTKAINVEQCPTNND
jgi:hypothetical protein